MHLNWHRRKGETGPNGSLPVKRTYTRRQAPVIEHAQSDNPLEAYRDLISRQDAILTELRQKRDDLQAQLADVDAILLRHPTATAA